jgi:hypothetical protein
LDPERGYKGARLEGLDFYVDHLTWKQLPKEVFARLGGKDAAKKMRVEMGYSTGSSGASAKKKAAAAEAASAAAAAAATPGAEAAGAEAKAAGEDDGEAGAGASSGLQVRFEDELEKAAKEADSGAIVVAGESSESESKKRTLKGENSGKSGAVREKFQRRLQQLCGVATTTALSMAAHGGGNGLSLSGGGGVHSLLPPSAMSASRALPVLTATPNPALQQNKVHLGAQRQKQNYGIPNVVWSVLDNKKQ